MCVGWKVGSVYMMKSSLHSQPLARYEVAFGIKKISGKSSIREICKRYCILHGKLIFNDNDITKDCSMHSGMCKLK